MRKASRFLDTVYKMSFVEETLQLIDHYGMST